MFSITLPDGSKRKYLYPVSPLLVARDISPRLEKTCIAGCINKKLIDATDLIKDDTNLTIITTQDTLGLKIIRQSCVHLLGYALKKLWPNVKMAIGNVISKGFYYDIDLNYTLTKKDLFFLEQEMHKLVKNNYDVIKKEVNWNEAKNIFLKRNESYKIFILENIIPRNKKIKLYYHEKYVDMCKGPNITNIRFCNYFTIKTISGAYWRGNKNNKMLQRIYGTAWASKLQLNNYLKYLEEVDQRDHRKILKNLNFYHMQEEEPGMIFWNYNGWIVFRELEAFLRIKLQHYQYYEVKTPFIMDRALWEKTGHWDNYADYMFTTISENKEYCIKPMNCPAHVHIFNQGLKSYRDLPLRIAEFGSCHRKEFSGSLHGLMRLRNFTQDDAHIFCTENQIHDEVNNCIKMIYDIYHIFGFKKITVKFSTRPKKRIGNDFVWNKAEKDLENVLIENKISFENQVGEGAFYGPKIEFILFDCLDREWQCGTIQLDFSLSSRLEAFYIGKNNEKLFPVIIHRAILGSIERFIGILTEEYKGFFPTWLSPLQVVVINISDKQLDYANKINKKLLLLNIRSKIDIRNEKMGFKIREHTLNRVPYILICGDKEKKEDVLSIRTRYGKNIKEINIDSFIKKLQYEIINRSFDHMEE